MSRVTVSEQYHRQAAGGVPDTRARGARGQVRTPQGLATPVHCANCGKHYGYVFGSVAHFWYLCSENGCDKYGTGLDLPIVDAGLVEKLAKKEGPSNVVLL